MRKGLFLAFAILLLTSFTVFATGQSEDTGLGKAYELSKEGDTYEPPITVEASEEYTIGVALPYLANPHFVGMAYGYTDEAEKLGVESVIYDAGGYEYLDVQHNHIEDFISMPVDAIALVAINYEGSVPMVDKANAAGIPVVNANVMTANENVVTRIRSDDTAIGELEAKFIIDELDGKGNVLILAGPAGTSWAEGRSKGFLDYVEENAPELNIVDTRWLNNDPTDGLSEMEDLLQTYDDLDAVMCGSAVLGLGAAQAIESAGKSDDIVITGVDVFDDSIAAVRDGRLDAVVCQDTVAIGRWAIKAAVATLEGKADQLYKNYWTPVYLVTKDNVDDFEFEGVANPPKGWTLD